jgi:hypothetical protein
MASAIESTMIISTVIMTAASRTSVRYEPADGIVGCALMSPSLAAAAGDWLIRRTGATRSAENSGLYPGQRWAGAAVMVES